MNDASLERELVRARHVDLATMREKLDQIRTGLEMMMEAAELEFQVLIEEREEHSYGLSETVATEPVAQLTRRRCFLVCC
ncbi:hypothetical protein GQ600_3808 [Phytophthora cactorum]|nr:hypothetical protein GQ600_3808 [Phytophthora cactorum]